MICPYCSSDKIVLRDGEYVCTECGTVVGYEVVPPRVKLATPVIKSRRIIALLEEEDKQTVKMKYSDMVKFYISKIARELGVAGIEQEAMRLFSALDKRAYQGKSPRAVAAAVVYLATERARYHVHKRDIAALVNISKFTVRDTVSRLRRYVPATE